ncbi:MAG: 50S ribosomal protein L25/general stress protein Ctc [Deltaproteobacteria bacterium CG11_big_fil_rev_8_21_14_0_20_47_16]|nr:MAG: 50S ribosomal protein L25/general stress protein Ctc [Deltaproteobacteria bacterium CG11_big_fil_rev_8_21_14_0_20_47_16]
MEKTSLNAEARVAGKSLNNGLRNAGKVPAILYGREHKPVSIAVDNKEVRKAVSTKAGFNVLIDLNIGGKENIMARVCDYQAHPITRDFTHIDFQVVDLKRKIEVEVPLHIEGKSPGVKEGGVLDIQRRTLHVKCLPTSIPEFISVDISALNIGDNVHINDLKLPEGVECPHDVNFTILAVVPPAKEEEVVAAAPAEGEVAAGAVPSDKGAAPAEGAAPAAEKKSAGK